MKNKNYLMLLLGMSFLVVNVTALAQNQSYVKIEVDGLSCPFCAYGLEKNLKKVDGAKDVYISVKEGYTTFVVPGDSQPSEDTLTKIVEDAGFTARKISYSETPFVKDDE